jgi:hypothetical protein
MHAYCWAPTLSYFFLEPQISQNRKLGILFLNWWIWANLQRIIELFTQKVVTKLSKIEVWDPGSEIRKNLFRIPDLGSKRYQLLSVVYVLDLNAKNQWFEPHDDTIAMKYIWSKSSIESIRRRQSSKLWSETRAQILKCSNKINICQGERVGIQRNSSVQKRRSHLESLELSVWGLDELDADSLHDGADDVVQQAVNHLHP